MKSNILTFLFITLSFQLLDAQVYPVTTIQNNGNINQRINFAYLGDGYTAAEQGTFVTDVGTINADMFSQVPFSNYANFFNAYAIQVPSNQSGADHPATAPDEPGGGQPVLNVDTYFDSAFDSYNIHRLLVPFNYSGINNVLATNLPQYDQAIIIVNSPYYGGSGGQYATNSTNASANEIAIHEIGHSFADLGDEYYATCNESPNLTTESNPALVRWDEWIGEEGIGVYPIGNGCNRPHQNCKMQYLGSPFCAVCRQAIIDVIYSLVSPIDAYFPSSVTQTYSGTPMVFDLDLIYPIPNTLQIEWILNGVTLGSNTETITISDANLNVGSNTLVAKVIDNTTLSRSYLPNAGYEFSVSWTIENSGTVTVNSCNPETQELYVDHIAVGANDGSSWANAFTDLQSAIAATSPTNCTAIYVAEGTYKPTTTTNRGIYFTLENDVNIYGGFSSGGGPANPDLYATILSGDIDGNGSLSGNSFHVVQARGGITASLHGLTIEGGNADNASSFARARGGGIFVNGANFNLTDCKVINNKAIFGGGLFSTLSNETYLLNSLFDSNEAGNGSAIYHSNETNLYLVGSRILNNNSTTRCAIEINNSLYTYIENSVIANNPSRNANALGLIATNRNQTCDIFNSTILGETKNKYLITLQIGFGDELTFNINNSIVAHQNISFDKNVVAFNNNVLNFNHNNCYFQGNSVMGTGTNVLFSTVAGDLQLNTDYSVSYCSPAVDAGNNTFASNRIYNGTVDMGAYESPEPCGEAKFVNNSEGSFNTLYNIYPNPARDMIYISSNLENISVSLFDILGKEMIVENNQNELDISQLAKGTYLINVYDGDQFLGVEKLVKY